MDTAFQIEDETSTRSDSNQELSSNETVSDSENHAGDSVKMIFQQESSLFAKAQSLGEGHLKQLSRHYRISTNSQNLPGMTFLNF